MFARLIRPHSIERRLLLWLLIITLVPSLTVLGAASWAGRAAARLLGASGSWSEVAQTGRALIQRINEDPNSKPQLRRAADAHARQLSTSLTQAGRWEFIKTRMRALLPLFFVLLALFVAAIAIWAARRMARSVSRPIRELVEWSSLLAREEQLPAPTRREQGEVKELQALRRALRNASGEMRQARERALEAERTRSWGEMARRVAHEMKNPLTPLRLASHRLNAVAEQHPELGDPIAVIAEETRRLEELAARFALLGRPTDGPRSSVDLSDLIERLLATDVPSGCDAKLTTSSGEPFVFADYNALIQAFRNVVRNAVEAVTPHSSGQITVVIEDAGHDVRVRIADNGRGIDEESGERIFEPDFTSKVSGTGLGLAVARQIFRAHGGEIIANPNVDAGAEFVVTLPRNLENHVAP